MSAIVKKLQPGDKVKVSFLRKNWYAVFSLDKQPANEDDAIGYIFAPLLHSFTELSAKTGKSKKLFKEKNESEQLVSIDFNNVDIGVFIKFISELTGKNFVIDKRVNGAVNIISPSKISVEEAYKVFESVLEVHGYSTVKSGKVIKIVPSPDARSKNIETMVKKEARSLEDKVVTQLVHLRYADPGEIKKLFAPLISKSSLILAYSPTNMLVITDTYSNITRLLKIVDVIDVTGTGLELSVIPLEFAGAEKLVKLLSTVFQTRLKSKRGDLGKSVKFVADERTNRIVLLASEDETVKIKKLIDLLDKETPRSESKIRVYYLENASAEDLAEVLQSLSAKEKTTSKGIKRPVVSEQVMITADKATNSLIIMADKDDYNILEKTIKKLDIPRSMVYIESLIMEVNVTKDFDIGAEWVAMGETDIGSKKSAFGGGFGGKNNYGDIHGMTPADVRVGTFPAGFSLGIFSELLDIGGIKFPGISALIQAYKKDKDVHILSTPQILTTDNEEAVITVGKNIPYLTKSGTTTTTETYNSYEYKDVGITLKITPQISKDRMVSLKIFQEITKLDELSKTGATNPSTLKRTIETTVIVKDKNTVVIGGLIDDSFSNTEYMIPCLGDIPLVGWLFRSLSETREKTNLFIFLTPHVIEDPYEIKKIFKEKKEQIDKMEASEIKMYKKGAGE
ncbi:MAG: type II secretion system secretin GspD [Desulfobacteraceae bacterium]|nr:type II secretion system secretin GspD [Desulfobacteraceae bacterium]MBC2719564.1 type II secretion system secretin GspD [Desulfobacteraceae bacterium]